MLKNRLQALARLSPALQSGVRRTIAKLQADYSAEKVAARLAHRTPYFADVVVRLNRVADDIGRSDLRVSSANGA